MADRRFRLDPPVDPWPMAPIVPGFAHDGRTRSFPASPLVEPAEDLGGPFSQVGDLGGSLGQTRRYTGKRGDLFGYVYELVLIDQLDNDTEYVGKTEQTMAERMSTGGSGHRSPSSIARDPWKARIAPGAAGYRILERVRCTGDGYHADRRALLRAEADWIDRRRPKRNDVRPVRPRGETARRERPTETRRERTRPIVVRRGPTVTERRARRRMQAWLVLVALLSLACVVLVRNMDLPWPWWAEVLGAVGAGITTGTWAFLRALRFGRRLGRR